MPDHLHAILALPREPGMTTVIKNWKKYVAGKHGVDWQRDFFDHRLRDHHEVDEKTNYILMNPVRKACVSGGRLRVDLSAKRPSASAARVGLRHLRPGTYLDATIHLARR
jgi:hypothetical protein